MLDPNKLRDNAVTSIRHGIEDFEKSTMPLKNGGDPSRAISSARNIFAGVLLLFKFRLINSITDQTKIAEVIYKPPRDIIPHPDGNGGVKWIPVGRFQKNTIDVSDIQNRFESFGIDVDWDVMKKIQEERNYIEHLHPTQNTGAISAFIAEIFPILGKFITEELDEVPATFLGEETWAIMLKHHDFFIAQHKECIDLWESASINTNTKTLVNLVVCDCCASPLVKPDEGSVEHYICVACNHRDKLIPQLEIILEDFLGGYNPYDGDESPTRECPECEHALYAVTEGNCYWCDYELQDRECKFCDEPLGLDEQHTDGMCSYCDYQWSKDD